MLSFNLNPIFKARGIEKPYSFLVKAGLSPHTAYSLLKKETRIFRLDHVEFLCRVLNCEPHDLLMWHPEQDVEYPANYPLKFLKPQEDLSDTLKSTLSNLPFKELKKVTKSFLDTQSGEKG